MTRMTRKRPDQSCELRLLTRRALIFLQRPLGTHWLPERPFPFFKESGERLRECKAGSGSFGVICVIVVLLQRAIEEFDSVLRPVVKALRAAEAMRLLVVRHGRRIDHRSELLLADARGFGA